MITPPKADELDGGTMASRVAAFDWSRTPIGPRDAWPQSLRTAVSICLNSRFPMMIWWGRSLTNVYNDGYAEMLGTRHPDALGRSGRDVWADVWPTIASQVEAVMARGESTWTERGHFVMNRNGPPENAWFTWSYSPIYDERGAVAGLFNTVREDTRTVLAERRLVRAAEERRLADERARLTLEAERANLAAMIEKAPAFIAMLRGPDHVFELANEPYYALVGRRDLIGRRVADALPEVVDQGFIRLLDDVFRTGNAFVGKEIPITLGLADARERRFVNFAYQAMHDADGSIRGIFVHGVDVTDAVRARDAIRDSEARYRALITASADVAYRMSADWSTMYPLDGRGLLASNAAPLADFAWLEQNIPPDERHRVLATVARAIADKTFFELEHRLNGPDGSVTWTSSRAVPMLDAAGEIVEWFGTAADITDRKRAEAALRESEQRYRALTTAGADIVYRMSADWSTMLPLDGRRLVPSNDEPMGDWAWLAQKLPADEHVRTRAAADRAIAERGLFELEHRVNRPDGSIGWTHSRAAPIVDDDDGRIIEWFGTASDVTDRRRAGDELVNRERRLAVALGLAELGTWEWAPASDLLSLDERSCEIYGFAPGECTVGAVLFGRIHPEDVGRIRAEIAASLAAGGRLAAAYRIVRPGGEVRYIDSAGDVFAGADGRYAGVIADVTDRERAEAALRESEARHRLIMANVKDHAIFTLDLAGRVTGWNVGAERLFGHAADEMLGRPAAIVFTPEDRVAERPRIEMELAAGDGMAEDTRPHVRKDGSRFFASGSMEGLRDDGGRLLGYVKVVRDITDRRRAEEQRQKLLEDAQAARADADRAARMKDEFLATLSHELRTPLSAILGWSQMLARASLKPETLAEGLKTIERNARVQTQIIDDLLDMSRIISGKIALDPRRIDLAGVVRAAMDTVRAAAAAKDIAMVFDAPEDGRHPVLGDLNRLQQVFWNLLSNAIKFTPKGGVVRARLDVRQSQWHVDVSDTGEGISPDFVPHVFDRFRQADASTTRRHGGLGLGLAIVKQLVELHGGSVGVRSEGRGSGSTFTVALPMTVLHDAPAADRDLIAGNDASGAARPAEVREGMAWDLSTGDLRGSTILVVDDEPDARSLLVRLLTDQGATVSVAASAGEAYEAIQRDRPAVLVSDVGMPGEDGLSLMRRIRKLPADRGGQTPAIALTAYARAEDRVKAIRAGFQLHVPKPVEPAELVSMIDTLLDRGDDPAR